MRPNTLGRVFEFVALIFGFLAVLEAHVAPKVTPPPPVSMDTVELSPFVVSAVTESGYRATQTLAGTRLKTDLKDIAEVARHRQILKKWQTATKDQFGNATAVLLILRFRDECLNREQLWTLTEARVVIEDFRQDYNAERPHSSLGYLAPQRFVAEKSLPIPSSTAVITSTNAAD